MQLLITFLGRYGTGQCTVGVGQVTQQRALGTGDGIAGDVAGEIGNRLDHVSHH